ncbi:hypothetical protein [Streptomyces murinus]|uniref:hypothetical protein n=1 Tax=Streptomyces murinus TaxID=33900 RepID=UPI0018F7ADFA|nr:hypothetical protein [Streptomyces murinus]
MLRPRALLQRLNDAISPAEPDDEPADDEALAEPDAEPAVPAQPVRGGARLPDWRAPLRDILDLEKEREEKEARRSADSDAEPCDHPNPHAVHARPTGELVAYWCEDCETQLEVPDPDEEEGDEEEADGGVSAKIRRYWSLRGNGAKVYARPTYREPKAPKQSLLEAWAGMRPTTRHGLYNGTALAIGFALGVPQFFTAETAYLVETYHSWTAFYVVIWYGVALGIWMFDRKSRSWLPPFALMARVPLVSLVIGVALYGNPV